MRVPLGPPAYAREIAVETWVLAGRSGAILIGWHGFSASFAKVANTLPSWPALSIVIGTLARS